MCGGGGQVPAGEGWPGGEVSYEDGDEATKITKPALAIASG